MTTVKNITIYYRLIMDVKHLEIVMDVKYLEKVMDYQL